jgi:hypothetical protein
MAQVGYSLWMMVGPWCAVRAFEGHLPGALFRGLLLYWSEGSWQRLESSDLLRVGIAHYVTGVIPGTLWVIDLCGRWCACALVSGDRGGRWGEGKEGKG